MIKHLTQLGHRMTRIFLILLFIGLACGRDKYPYFSDMSKQLEFEQKKILVENNVDKQQVISGGGSEFNWLSLMSNYQSTFFISRKDKIKHDKIISNQK